jgi:hypothetical protein
MWFYKSKVDRIKTDTQNNNIACPKKKLHYDENDFWHINPV